MLRVFYKVNFTIKQAMKDRRGWGGNGDTALLFLNPATRWGLLINAIYWLLYAQKIDTVSIDI
jgi:hypothetical protein